MNREMNPQRDRNVLIALMAAQLAFISHEQLQGVLRAWTQDKSQDMGVLLRQRAYIDQESLDLLLALVARRRIALSLAETAELFKGNP